MIQLTASQRMLLNHFNEPLRSIFEMLLYTKEGRSKIARGGLKPLENSIGVVLLAQTDDPPSGFDARLKATSTTILDRYTAMEQLLWSLAEPSELESEGFRNYKAKLEELRVTLASPPREAEP